MCQVSVQQHVARGRHVTSNNVDNCVVVIRSAHAYFVTGYYVITAPSRPCNHNTKRIYVKII